jgi:protein O-mannosyl-transferase
MNRPATQAHPAPAGACDPVRARSRFPVWLTALWLALGTVALYWPATSHDFVNYDDQEYVTENPIVQGGLNWEGMTWAFSKAVCGNWQPMTVLSHMLDCQVFGLTPWGHHLTSLLLHALNAALVFMVLNQMTGARWRSLFVAALFAAHPLRVESVAWVAERKDVLSGFFGLLALIFYARYAKKSRGSEQWSVASNQISSAPLNGLSKQTPDHSALTTDHQSLITDRRSLAYLLSLLCLALGFLSKPMLVTWPLVMLVLDYWPLERFKPGCAWRLVREKAPFLALATTASVVTFVVQQHRGALTMVGNLPFGARSGNALVSYCRYLGKLFWPTDLAVFYPHPGHWPLQTVLRAGGLILGISMLLVAQRRRSPFLLVGWLWFLGVLVPVIGLVQIGGQAMADRYTYLPSLGPLILVVWGAYKLTKRWHYGVTLAAVASSAAIVLCVALTRQQLEHWANSEELFRHALAVTEANYIAHDGLGTALARKGQLDEAISHHQEAIRLKPDFTQAHNNLGYAFVRKGRTAEAISHYQEAIRLRPDNADAHYNLGISLGRLGQLDEAIREFQEALRLKPDNADAHNNLGVVLGMKGQLDGAISQFQEALRLKPDSVDARNNLARVLAMKHAPASR